MTKQPDADVGSPPHKTAVCSSSGDAQRDEPIRAIEEHGRIGWQKENDYGFRSYIELAIQRYRRIIGNCMKAGALPQQESETWFRADALNTMTNIGTPVSVIF